MSTVRQNPKAVLFDLDGTLLDSFPGHYAAYVAMFSHFGIAVTKERFLGSYSPNWYRTYEAFELNTDHWETADTVWLAEAEKHRPELFPGVAEVLARLSGEYILGIVTSGSKKRVLNDIDRLDIASFFRVLVTGDDIVNPKPAPEGLEIALRELSIRADEAVYVGDALADFEMASAAGVRFFGVPSEFANLAAGHSDYQIHPITDLPNLLAADRMNKN